MVYVERTSSSALLLVYSLLHVVADTNQLLHLAAAAAGAVAVAEAALAVAEVGSVLVSIAAFAGVADVAAPVLVAVTVPPAGPLLLLLRQLYCSCCCLCSLLTGTSMDGLIQGLHFSVLLLEFHCTYTSSMQVASRYAEEYELQT